MITIPIEKCFTKDFKLTDLAKDIFNLDTSLVSETEKEIYPLYLAGVEKGIIDKAHCLGHITETVYYSLITSNIIAPELNNKVFTSAIFHDIGLYYGDREHHHLYSADAVLLHHEMLSEFFSPVDIMEIRTACLDHRVKPQYNEFLPLMSKIIKDGDNASTLERLIDRVCLYNIHREFTLDEIMHDAKTYLRKKYGNADYFSLDINYKIHKDFVLELSKVINNDILLKKEVNKVYCKIVDKTNYYSNINKDYINNKKVVNLNIFE